MMARTSCVSSSRAARSEGYEGGAENDKCIPILDSQCCATESKIQIKFYNSRNSIDLNRLYVTQHPHDREEHVPNDQGHLHHPQVPVHLP